MMLKNGIHLKNNKELYGGFTPPYILYNIDHNVIIFKDKHLWCKVL